MLSVVGSTVNTSKSCVVENVCVASQFQKSTQLFYYERRSDLISHILPVFVFKARAITRKIEYHIFALAESIADTA